MNLIGRYEKVRGMETHTGAYTPPLILDKGRAHDDYHLRPYERSEEWWKSPSGLWVELWKLGKAFRHLWDSERGAAGDNGGTSSYLHFIGFPTGETTAGTDNTHFRSNYVA